MSRKDLPQVVTANDLLSGVVVFWTGQGWSEALADALMLDDPQTQKEALAVAEGDAGRVVGPYLAAVDAAGLVRFRERIRITGPTVDYAGRPDEAGGPGAAAGSSGA